MISFEENDAFAQALRRLYAAKTENALEMLYGLCRNIHEMDVPTVTAAYQALATWKVGCFPFSKPWRAARKLEKALVTRMGWLIKDPSKLYSEQHLRKHFRSVAGERSEFF
jgi:hypothetical protein